MTVGELRQLLSNYDDDMHVGILHCNPEGEDTLRELEKVHVERHKDEYLIYFDPAYVGSGNEYMPEYSMFDRDIKKKDI